MSNMSELHREIQESLVTAYLHLTRQSQTYMTNEDAAGQVAHAYLLLTGMDMEQEVDCV